MSYDERPAFLTEDPEETAARERHNADVTARLHADLDALAARMRAALPNDTISLTGTHPITVIPAGVDPGQLEAALTVTPRTVVEGHMQQTLRQLLTALSTDYLDVVFDAPPGVESGRFVEVEDPTTGRSITAGEWIDRGDGNWALRLPVAAPATARREPHLLTLTGCDDRLVLHALITPDEAALLRRLQDATTGTNQCQPTFAVYNAEQVAAEDPNERKALTSEAHDAAAEGHRL